MEAPDHPTIGPGDSGFWDAVAREDATALAGLLGTDEDRLAEILPLLSSWLRNQGVDEWRYRVAWTPYRPAPARTPAGTWMVVAATDDAWASAITQSLTEHGCPPIRLTGTADREALAGHLRVASHAAGDFLGVLYLPGHTPSLLHAVVLLQALGDADVPAPLWMVTSEGVQAVPGEPGADPAATALWGLGRVAALEHPERWGGLIDLPTAPTSVATHHLLDLLTGHGGEDQLAVRPEGVFARRLEHAPPVAAASPWRARGTVLVTGGTGALGGQLSRWLARQGAEHLVLISRTGDRAPGADQLRADMEELGARITFATCDVTDRSALAEVLTGLPGLTAVFHAAGVLADGVLASMTAADLDAVLRTKADAAFHLHELTMERKLDAFVLFSSLAATVGGPGQGNYAAANAYLDGLARMRRAAGLPATSIAWGPWSESGMAATDPAVLDRVRRSGVRPMDPHRALQALGRALSADDTEVTVADFDWDRFLPFFTATRPSTLFARLRPASSPETPPDETWVPVAGRPDLVLDLVRSQVAAVLGHSSADRVQPALTFRELGFDSLTAVELRNRLNAATRRTLPATLIFDYPTPAELAEHLLEEVAGGESAGPAPAVQAATTAEPIAIVGMACRFPGGVTSPEGLWRLVVDGVDAVAGFPADRGW
ncbi:SDR family NAD(P)-dependent oxidoreductase, partial [Micromonospora sp. DT201]|uniref:SDR family NAD(P)-dependent oxidoreductase n=1 Tax=Micromonospora sp. DT201 TaxID=3393442 RepID=UPI003CEE6FF0